MTDLKSVYQYYGMLPEGNQVMGNPKTIEAIGVNQGRGVPINTKADLYTMFPQAKFAFSQVDEYENKLNYFTLDNLPDGLVLICRPDGRIEVRSYIFREVKHG
jgi:hypothetical protein